MRLRFRAGTAAERRLRESTWHPTQEITDLPEGGCEWSAQVAEPQEMVPWVRGWGADVEVLEPEELRETIKHEAQRLARVYGEKEMKSLFIAHLRKKTKLKIYGIT